MGNSEDKKSEGSKSEPARPIKGGRELDIVDESAEVNFIMGIEGESFIRIEENSTVGSADGAGICIKNNTIAPIHCKFYLHDRLLYLMDMGGQSGTKINARPLLPGNLQLVTFGDKIKLGQVAIEIYDHPPLELESITKKDKDKIVIKTDKDKVNTIKKLIPMKRVEEEVELWDKIKHFIKKWFKKILHKLNPFKKKDPPPEEKKADEAEALKPIKVGFFKRIWLFFKRIFSRKKDLAAPAPEEALTEEQKKLKQKQEEEAKKKKEVENLKPTFFKRIILFFRRILRLDKKKELGPKDAAEKGPQAPVTKKSLWRRFINFLRKITGRKIPADGAVVAGAPPEGAVPGAPLAKKEDGAAADAAARTTKWRRFINFIKRILFFWRRKSTEGKEASADKDKTDVDLENALDTTGKLVSNAKAQNKGPGEKAQASAFRRSMDKFKNTIGQFKVPKLQDNIPLKVKMVVVGPWSRIYALAADCALAYVLSIYLFEVSPWKEEAAKLHPMLMELINPYLAQIGPGIDKILALEEVKKVLEMKEVQEFTSSSQYKMFMDFQGFKELKEIPFAKLFTENFPFISTFVTLSLCSHLLMGVSFSSFFLGIRGSGGLISNRLMGLFRLLLGWVLAPFVVFDLPCVFGKRTFKEVLSGNKLRHGGAFVRFAGITLFLPLFLSTLLFIPVVRNIPTIDWGEEAKVITLDEGNDHSKGKKKDRPSPGSEQNTLLYSEVFNSNLSAEALKDIILLPRFESKGKGPATPQLVAYHLTSKDQASFNFLPSFDFIGAIQYHEQDNFLLGQYFPLLDVATMTYTGGKVKKRKSDKNKKSPLKVTPAMVKEFHTYLLGSLNFHWKHLDEFAQTFGPFWQGPLYLRKDLYDYLQASAPLDLETKKVGDRDYLILQGEGPKLTKSKKTTASQLITFIPLVTEPALSMQMVIGRPGKKNPFNLHFTLDLIKGGPQVTDDLTISPQLARGGAGRSADPTSDPVAISRLALMIFDQFGRQHLGPYTPELWAKDSQLLLQTYHKMAVNLKDPELDTLLSKDLPLYIKTYEKIYLMKKLPRNKLEESKNLYAKSLEGIFASASLPQNPPLPTPGFRPELPGASKAKMKKKMKM